MFENTPTDPIIIKKIGNNVLKKDVRKALHQTQYLFTQQFPETKNGLPYINEDLFEACMKKIRRTYRYI